MATPLHQNPCSGGHEIYNLGRHFLDHHCYLLSLSDVCMGVEKKILKEIIHFHYMIWPHPSTKTPALRVIKFTIW